MKDMWPFVLSLMMFVSVSFAAASTRHSSCELQGQFHLNGMHKAGDIILGGLFEIHFFSTFANLTFTSKPQHPTCHG